MDRLPDCPGEVTIRPDSYRRIWNYPRKDLNNMSVFLGIDIGTSGQTTLAIDPSGSILASAMETYPCLLSQTPLERAGPRRLVASDRSIGPQDDGQGKLKPADVKADRSVGPDAWLRLSR